MLGAIIGDIAGSRFERRPMNDYNFELFADWCGYTDDTLCTVAIADAMLQGSDFGESLLYWCRRFPCARGGYGRAFRGWLKSENPQPYNSFGNGSAMRVSPVAWLSKNEEEVVSNAIKSAECTHNHPEGIKGAVAVALAIYHCRVLYGGKLPEHTDKEPIMLGLQRALEVTGYDIESIKLEDVQNKFDSSCQGTVPVALWIVSNSTGFEDAIRNAVSLGADADTLGAIVGSIAEAIWGIPEWMKERAMTYLFPRMQDVVKDFYTKI